MLHMLWPCFNSLTSFPAIFPFFTQLWSYYPPTCLYNTLGMPLFLGFLLEVSSVCSLHSDIQVALSLPSFKALIKYLLIKRLFRPIQSKFYQSELYQCCPSSFPDTFLDSFCFPLPSTCFTYLFLTYVCFTYY